MNKSQRIAQKPPGALMNPERKAMKGFLDRKDHQESGSRNQCLTPHVTLYLTTVIQALKNKRTWDEARQRAENVVKNPGPPALRQPGSLRDTLM